MKAPVFILAVYILFLGVAPGVASIVNNYLYQKDTCCQMSCEAGEAHDDANGKQDACDQNCNPFQLCKCGGILLTNGLEFSTMRSSYPLRSFVFTENMPDDVAFDFWQPPRLA